MNIVSLISRAALLALIACQPIAAQQLPNLDPASDAVGSVAGRFRVDETGQANYSIAIATTPGTAGVAPELSLNYSSQAGDSWLGRGWSVGGQSQISRCRMTREHADPMSSGNFVGTSVNFIWDDVFCLDGQRLLLVSGSYGAPDSEYRPETDPFTRVFARGGNNSADITAYTGPTSFVVQRRDGTESQYGATDDARMLINNCGGTSGRACAVSSWAINRVEDSSGNYLLYLYAKWNLGVLVEATAPADEQHLSEVRYTGKRRLTGQSAPDSAPYARVLFVDEARAADHRITGWQAGSRYALTRQLIGIAVREPLATDVRYYALEHRSAPSDSGQLLLQRIRECSTIAQTLCYSATEFKVDERSYALNVASSVQMSSSVLSQRLDLRIGDVDGDGRQDIVWSTAAASCSGRPAVRVAFGGHSGTGSTSALSLITVSTAQFCLQRSSAQIEDSWHLVDYDGDGRDDLLLAGPDNSTWRLHRSLGRPTTSTGAIFSPTDSLVAEVIPVGSSTTALAQLYDFNGDGLLDLLLPGPPSGVQGLVVRLMEIDHATGTRGFGEPLPVDLRFAVNDKCPQDPNPPPGYIINNCAYTFVRGDPQVRGIDLDGDGRGDLMLKVVRNYSTGATPRPAGPPRFVSPAEFEEIANSRTEPTANSISSTHWYFFTSAGVQGETLRFHQYFVGDITALPGGPAPEFSAERGRIHLSDVTGDGLADLIYSPVSASTSVRVRVNIGWGFSESQGPINGLSELDRMQLADLDGDGRSDLVYPARFDSGFAYCGLTQVPGSSRPYCVRYAGRQGLPFGDAIGLDALAATDGTRPLSDFDGLFADFDGDGQVDYLRLAREGGQSYAEALMVRRQARHTARDAITEIVDGFGARTRIDYQPLTNRAVYRPGTDGWKLELGRKSPVFDLLAPMYVVASVESSAPLEGDQAALARTDYRYGGARMQSGGRGFLGFAVVDSFDANEHAVLQSYGASRTRYNQAFPLVGTPDISTRAVLPAASGFSLPQAIATSVAGSCRNDPEAASNCFDPNAGDWPADIASGGRLHTSTLNVYQVIASTQQGSCPGTRSRVGDILEFALADPDRAVPLLPPTQQPLFAPLLGTVEESFAIDSTGTDNSRLSLTFSLQCYQDPAGNLTRAFIDVRDPSNFEQSLHFTETVSTFDNGPMSVATAPWRLGRLTGSTTEKTREGLTDTRSASFVYDLTSGAKTGQLLAETVSGNGGLQATRTLYDLDDYGNRVAAYICSTQEADGSTLTDAECRDRNRIKHRPTAADGSPTTAVHRYTRSEYDARGRYLLRTYAPFFDPGATNQLVERISSEVHSRDVFGNPTEVSDANGRRSYARFGALGRPYASEVQGGARSVVTLRICGGAVSCPPGTVYRQQTTSTAGPTQWSYHDRLGHVVVAAAESFEAAVPDRNFTASCAFRDIKGRAARSSVPFFLPAQSGAAPSFTGVAASPCASFGLAFESRQYDVLSRPLSVLAADNSTLSFSYTGMRAEQTNAMAQRSWELRNVLGEVVQEIQATPTQGAQQGLVVSREFDAQGNPRFVRRNAGAGEIVNETVFDGLGRVTESRDPDRGHERFSYNAAGELIRRVDAQGVETRMHYDALGRMWKRETGTVVLPEAPGPQQIFKSGFESSNSVELQTQTDLWQYDTAIKGVGSVHIEERVAPGDELFRNTHGYDDLGRPAALATLMRSRAANGTLDTRTRTAGTVYDALGRVWQQTDATGSALEQVYTARGFVEQLRNGLNVGEVYNRILEVNARGQVTRERRGDHASMEVRRGYSATRGWLTAVDAGPGDALQRLRYDYDALGNLRWRHDQRRGELESFGYDALNRLTSTHVGIQGLSAPAVLAMTYDALGNICTKQTGSSVASYQYRGRAGCAGSQGSATASPHAVSSVDGRSLFYDANGRMTVRTGATAAQNRYTDFSGLDQLVLVVMGDALMPAAMLELAYTPGGSRYLRRESINGAVTITRTFGSVEELQRPDGTQLTRRYIGGVLIETRIGTAAATKQYLFHDHLGSLDVIANESGAVLERLSFDAHGQRRAATQWTSTLPAVVSAVTPRGFTGHEHLDVFGLIHMNGRVYDPTLGRFIQPDPMLDAGIQGLNRYSYVLNNPLSLTDPSGYLSLGQILRTVVAVAITVYTGGWAAGYWGAALTTTQAFGVVVAGGFAAGAVQSGTLKGGLQGAFSAAIFFGIGSYFDQANSASSWARTGDKLNTIGRVSKIVAHGAAGGIMSDLQGGKFAHGFASAGFSEAAGPLTEGIQSDFMRGAAHALIGGSASSLSGGKFANGAVTAAMSFSFNELAHAGRAREGREAYDADAEQELQALADRAYEIAGRAPGEDGIVEITHSEFSEIFAFERARISMRSRLRGGYENLSPEEFGWEIYYQGDSILYGDSSIGGYGGVMYRITGAPVGFGGPYLGGNLNYVNQGLLFAAANRPLAEAFTAVELWNSLGHSSNQYLAQRIHLTAIGHEMWGKGSD